MNKLEANLVLLSVAFFWGVQYVFFRGLPEGVSTFAFMALTYTIGFLLVAAVFSQELWKITKRVVKQSFLTAMLLFAANTLLTYGSRSLDSTISGFLATSYIIFVPLILLLFKQKATRNNLIGMAVCVAGLMLSTGKSLSRRDANCLF